MKKSEQVGKYILSDFLSASLAWLLFNLLRFYEMAIYEGFGSFADYLSHTQVIKGYLLIPFFWLILYFFSGYYNKTLGKSRLTELFSTFLTVLVGVVLLFFVIVLNDLPRSFEIYYKLFFGLLILQFTLTYIPRLLITQCGIDKIKSRKWALNILIIGTGMKACDIAKNLYELGYNISGFVSEGGGEKEEEKVSNDCVLGNMSHLPSLVESIRIDEFVLAVETSDDKKLTNILYSLYRYKRPVRVLADRLNKFSKVQIRTIRGIPLVDVTDNNISSIEKNLKLFIDKVFSLLALIILSPLFVYFAWRVRKDSPGPVIFRQERIGYKGEPFIMYKFRTMYVDAEKNGPLLVTGNDKRITPFGFVMRKFRLDELPQFWNVLKGDMSIVGPRPERKYFIDEIVRKAPYYYLLQNVHPGITSLGMVKYGYASDVDKMIERLEYDLLYYKNMSLLLDTTILIYTMKTVITGKGI